MKWLIVANWKMNPASVRDVKKLFEATKKAADKTRNASIIVAPPSLYIESLRATYRGKKLTFAVQNAHFEDSGAFTGEISLAQAADLGVQYTIIGHAERRAMGETDDDTRQKVGKAFSLGMIPILCVGEKERTAEGGHFVVIRDQLRAGFSDAPESKIGKVVIAYEPVWAIGATEAMSPRDMHEMAIFIRKTIVELYGERGMKVQILYGGSIDADNVSSMLRDGDVAGILVGRASADPAKLTAFLSEVAKTK